MNTATHLRAGVARALGLMFGACFACAAFWLAHGHAAAQMPLPPSIRFQIQNPNERLEMVVNSSRILSLGQKIPQVQVNDKEILAVTVLSATEVQISALKRGVTQVNLWTENKEIYTVDVKVFPDARELIDILQSQFPNAALKVVPTATSVIISGYVDEPNHVGRVIEIAEDYYPKVINHMTVSGVQQVLLDVKVIEVSRSKLRTLGVDWALRNGVTGDFFAQGVGSILTMAQVPAQTIASIGTETMSGGLVGSPTQFFGFVSALERDNLAKVIAEPKIVTVSGRPAYFNAGGELPIPVPQSLGTISIQWKRYGTQVDFVPIVLGNGNIRLEVRPRVSEIDPARSIVLNGNTVPALRVRETDTGVEMRSGQTLALAGLIQQRVESESRKIPYLGNLPVIGVAFRRNQDKLEEVELLIVVTPHLVDAMDACEAPSMGPGMLTCTPNDCEFYFGGALEVPSNPCAGICPPGVEKCETGYPGYMGGGADQRENGVYYESVPDGNQPMPAAPAEAVPPGATEPVALPTSRQSSGSVTLTAPAGPAITRQSPVTQPNGYRTSYNAYNPSSRQLAPNTTSPASQESGQLIGPIGYDNLQ